MKLAIQRFNYSSNPWRLVDENGGEVYAPEVFDHPTLGQTVISGPVCAATKSQLVDKLLGMLAAQADRIQKLTAKALLLSLVLLAGCTHLPPAEPVTVIVTRPADMQADRIPADPVDVPPVLAVSPPGESLEVIRMRDELRVVRDQLRETRTDVAQLAKDLQTTRDDLRDLRKRLTDREHERNRDEFTEGRTKTMRPDRGW